MPTPTSGFVYITGIGVVGYPGGVATLYDGCDYNDGDVVIRKGIVTAFDPSGFGIFYHDDLGNLDWDLSGHVGDADKIAAFDSAGVAAYLTVGPGLTVSGSTLQSASPWKAVARLATTAAGNLATDFCNGQTVDGETVVTGDRIVIKDQSPSSDNGLYTANASGPPTRAVDASTAALSRGLAVWVTDGTVNSHTVWVIDSDPVDAGAYRFKGLIKSASDGTGFLTKTGSTSAGVRTITAGSMVYVENGTGVSGDPTISVKGSVGVGGRLTLESGAPFSTSNQTAKTSVYWTPYSGNTVPIYDATAGDFINRSSAEISVAVPSTLFRLYDIFAYWTGSAVALETTNWNQTTASVSAFNAGTSTFTTSAAHGLSVGSVLGIAGITGTVGTDSTYGVNGRVWKVETVPSSTTFTLEGSNIGSLAYTSGGTVYIVPNTRATALTKVNGIETKNGDSSRTYLGTGMTTGVSGQTEMSFGPTEAKLLLWNMYNQVPMTAKVTETSSHSYTTSPWRYWNANPANRILFVNGQLQPVQVLYNGDGYNGSGYSAPGLDSVGGDAAAIQNGNPYRIAGSVAIGWLLGSAGVHQLNATEYGASGWVSTFVGLHLIISM